MKKIVIATIGLTALVALAPPASAAPADDPDPTFGIATVGVDITVPATVDLGGGAPGTVVTAAIGPITVDDTRAALDATWTATVTSTVFQTGGGTPPETVLAGEIDYWSGPATATTGIGVFSPGQLTAGTRQALSTSRTPFTLTLGVGNNSATWNPTLVVNVPLDSQVGTYTGTITHSVA
jgi:hypothetical protein